MKATDDGSSDNLVSRPNPSDPITHGPFGRSSEINSARSSKRQLPITYPSGRIVTMSYGTANSADDRLSRLASVSLTGDPGPLGQFV
jgi:hypothetical protein